MARVLNKLKFYCLILLLLSGGKSLAATVISGFVVSDQSLLFEKNNKYGNCYGNIIYPQLSLENGEEIAQAINSKIKDFATSYQLCNKKAKNREYKVNYEMSKGKKSYLSIKWNAKVEDKAVRIDSLNFNIDTGNFISFQDILSPLAKNFMPEIVGLSQSHLAVDTSWEQFLEKIEQKHIQFYIYGSHAYIVFNPHTRLDKDIVIAKLPKYLYATGF